MESQRTKVLLEKINSLYKSIDIDGGNMADIERDLMLSYIRQLYELFLHDGVAARNGARGAEVPEDPPFDLVETRTHERRPQPEPLKRSYQPPRIIEIPDIKIDTPAVDQSAPASAPKSEPRPAEEPGTQVTAQPEPAARPEPQAQKSHPELEALFEQKRAADLSEKLSESPVADLTRAMAINDRLLYMNELFGRSMSALDDALRQLNRFGSLDEAKPLLFNLAHQYDWAHEEKLDTAKTFVKMVRRRYL